MSLRPEHIIKEVRNLLQETLPRSIEIVLDLAENLPPILGDPTQLHQVLVNLGVNARDAMPEGGVLRISAELRSFRRNRITGSGLAVPPGDYVAVAVSDTGSGVAPEIMERIFEPFFTTKERGAGTGLGLSTVMGIVRGHGGGLDVDSMPGQGTLIRVLLPVDASSLSIAPHPESPAAIVGGGRTVLVVDDEEPVRAVTGMALDLKGFAHVDAADGREALDIFERDPDRFAAVILDHMMPRLGGAEVAERIKALRPRLPVVLISGLLADHSGTEDKPEGDAVLRKPFAPEDLYAALARAFAAAGE
jgi:CheY-like chemotaxis protein